jgi:hypothetical protein
MAAELKSNNVLLSKSLFVDALKLNSILIHFIKISKWANIAKNSLLDEPKPFIAKASSTSDINLKLPKKLFDDGATAISYKEGFHNGQPPTDGCCMANYQIIHKRLKQGVQHKDKYSGLTLQKSSANKWVIYDALSQTTVIPDPNMTYNFVTMPDKSIRVAESAQGAHSLLSGLAPYIRYAGEIKFDEHQHIKFWSNKSGSYKPSAFFSYQAGFEAAERFCAINKCNNAQQKKEYKVCPTASNCSKSVSIA